MSVRRGVYLGRVTADDPVSRTIVEASAVLLALRGDPAVSHETAALLWGLPTLKPQRDAIQVTRPRRGKGTIGAYTGVVVHQAGLPAAHRSERLGVPVTSPARTVADITRARSFRAGLVAADAALRLGLCTREDLVQVCADCVRWPGVRRAREVTEFADPRSESPLESLSRAAFREWGVPDPELQVWVTDDIRVDFLWRERRVIGEADGLDKYVDRAVLRREKTRQETLERLGFAVVRWTWDEVLRRPDAVTAWVQAALHRPR